MGCWVTTGTPEWLTVDAWSVEGGGGRFSGWYHKFNILLVTKEIQKIRCIQTEMYSKGTRLDYSSLILYLAFFA